jgi:LmbE family N-acetylglucosaminyl deacetylase
MADHIPDPGNMVELHPDHMRLLELAQAAFQARDNRHLWRQNTMKAAEEHGFYCDALWEELARQTTVLDGEIPTLEHPSVKRRKMVADLRREIVDAAQSAMIEALDELAHGPMLEDEE